MEIPLEKFNVQSFHTLKVKIQTQLMDKNMWGIVKGLSNCVQIKTNNWNGRAEMIKPKLLFALLSQNLSCIMWI